MDKYAHCFMLICFCWDKVIKEHTTFDKYFLIRKEREELEWGEGE